MSKLAHEELERMIVTQEIEPGVLISERALMDQTGFGRTPVREALQHLARDRMVEIHPNKGILIPPASVESQLQMLEVRRPLEALAARLACTRASDTAKADMAAHRDVLLEGIDNAAEYLDLLQKVQATLLDAADNPYLTHAIAPLHGLTRRFWYSHLTDASHEISIGSELYARLFTASLDGDATAAESTSHELNDYLVNFTYSALKRPGS